MFGFVFGTLCLVGMAGLFAGPGCGRHRGHHGFHGGHHGFHGGHHGFHGGHGGPWGRGGRHGGRRSRFGRAAGELFKRRLDIDEDQEDLVDLAMKDLQKAMGSLREALHEGKGEVADAFAREEVDEAVLAATFASQDEAIARFRREAVSALKQLHAVLEPEQRRTATRWLREAWA